MYKSKDKHVFASAYSYAYGYVCVWMYECMFVRRKIAAANLNNKHEERKTLNLH